MTSDKQRARRIPGLSRAIRGVTAVATMLLIALIIGVVNVAIANREQGEQLQRQADQLEALASRLVTESCRTDHGTRVLITDIWNLAAASPEDNAPEARRERMLGRAIEARARQLPERCLRYVDVEDIEIRIE